MIEPVVNGYVVVSARGGGAYRGVDREPWETIDARYYARTLPEDIRRIYETMRGTEMRGLWWPSSSSRQDARRLLSFTRIHEPSAEMIAIESPYLEHAVGRDGWTDSSVEFLGVDMVSVGEWSLLGAVERAGVGGSDDVVPPLTDAGLLRDASGTARIEAYYRRLAERGRVEPIADVDSGVPVEPVRVYLMPEIL